MNFNEKVVERAKERGLEDFESALFTVPCPICGKPMVFTHKSHDWESKVKPTLHKAFSNWCHTTCHKRVRSIEYD